LLRVKKYIKISRIFVFFVLLSFPSVHLQANIEYYFIIENPSQDDFIPVLTSVLLSALPGEENSAGIILYDNAALLLAQPVPLSIYDIARRLAEMTVFFSPQKRVTVDGIKEAINIADTQAGTRGIQPGDSNRLIIITGDKTASLSAKFSNPQNFNGGIFYLSVGEPLSALAEISGPENVWTVDPGNPRDGILACLETIVPGYKAVTTGSGSFKLGSVFKHIEKAVVITKTAVSTEKIRLSKSGLPISDDAIFKYDSYAVVLIDGVNAAGKLTVENGDVLAVFEIQKYSKTAFIILIAGIAVIVIIFVSIILAMIHKKAKLQKPVWKIEYLWDGEYQGKKVSLAVKKNSKKGSLGAGVSMTEILKKLKIDSECYDKNLADKSYIKIDKQKGWILVHPDYSIDKTSEQDDETPARKSGDNSDKINSSTDCKEFFTDESISLRFTKEK
jgi:hypothetical protein